MIVIIGKIVRRKASVSNRLPRLNITSFKTHNIFQNRYFPDKRALTHAHFHHVINKKDRF